MEGLIRRVELLLLLYTIHREREREREREGGWEPKVGLGGERNGEESKRERERKWEKGVSVRRLRGKVTHTRRD